MPLHIVAKRARYRLQVTVERCLLVRILAVTQVLDFDETRIELIRECAALAVNVGGGQVVADRAIVGRRVGKSLARQTEARLQADRAAGGLHFRDQRRIVRRIGDHSDVLPVLRRRTHHRGTADVDIFDCLLKGAIGTGNGFHEGIQVHGHQVYGRDARPCHRLDVRRKVAACQDAGVHLGMQGLHPAVEHLGETRVIADLGDLDPGLAQQLGGTAGGQDFESEAL